MSDVGSIGRSSSSNTLVGIDVSKKVAANENTKKEVGKLTSMKQLEGVQPETTGHKARRIIAGILGGLLLAAGIAAATVATTASFGLAAGILGTIAAFTGITGASVAAGAAGTAGIALIATSAHMAPEHAEVPSEQVRTDPEVNEAEVKKALEEKNHAFLNKGISEITQDNAIKLTEDGLKRTAQQMDDLGIPFDPDNYFYVHAHSLLSGLSNTFKSGDDVNAAMEKSSPAFTCVTYVQDVLKDHDIESIDLSPQNILTVRRDLQVFMTSDLAESFSDFSKKFGQADFQKEFAQVLIQEHDTIKNEKDRKLLEIFIAAIAIDNLDDLGKKDVAGVEKQQMIMA